METIQQKVVVVATVLLLCVSVPLDAFDMDAVEGVWVSTDELVYIALDRTGENEFFVTYLDFFDEHSEEFAEYGIWDGEKYIQVDLDDITYRISFSDANDYVHGYYMKALFWIGPLKYGMSYEFDKIDSGRIQEMRKPVVKTGPTDEELKATYDAIMRARADPNALTTKMSKRMQEEEAAVSGK